MKAKKLLALAGVSVAGAFLLAACSGGSSNQATYSFVYSADPNTLDYIAATRTTTSDVTSNLVDGLLENDRYGNFVPSLAEDWTVSEDGLTYTYKLRKDAKWYTSEGEEYGAVTAQDFVTGIKHAVESKSEGLFLIQNSIKGLDAYVKGETKDFNTVGVKALDDHTIQYTLVRPESFWNSKTTSGVLFPVNADFLKSQGKDFGSLKPSSILYNGPFYLKSLTSKSEIELVKNKDYYDAKNVHIDNVKLTFNDGSNPDSIIKNFEKGQYSFDAIMTGDYTLRVTNVPQEYSVDEEYLTGKAIKLVKGDNQLKIPLTKTIDHSRLQVKDTTIYVGDSWKPEENFVSATDKTGQDVPFEKITVSGQVDTSKAGVYPIVYSYEGKEETAHVTVKPDQSKLEVKDTTIYVGDSWKPEDNFVSATERDGHAISFDKVQVKGEVDTKKTGEYQISYTTEPVNETKPAVQSRLFAMFSNETPRQLTTVATVHVIDRNPTPLPDKNENNQTSSSTNQTTIKRSQYVTHIVKPDKQGRYPKTGEQTNGLYRVLGLVVLLIVIISGIVIKKKRK